MGPGGCISGPCLAGGFTFDGSNGIAVDGVTSTALTAAPATFVVRATDLESGDDWSASSTCRLGNRSAWDVPELIARMRSLPAGLRLVDGWIVARLHGVLRIGVRVRPVARPRRASSASPGSGPGSQIALTGSVSLPEGHGIYVVQPSTAPACPMCSQYAGTDELLGQVQPMLVPEPGPAFNSQIVESLDTPEEDAGVPLTVAACRSVADCIPRSLLPSADVGPQPKPDGDQILVEIVGATAQNAFWDNPGTTLHVVIEARSGGYQGDVVKFAPTGPVTVSFDLVDAAGRPISSTVVKLP